jgi:hypothetical protein
VDIEPDEETGGDAQGKASDLDGGVEFLFSQLPESDLPEVAKHAVIFG